MQRRAQLLEPASLREAMREHAQALYGMYARKNEGSPVSSNGDFMRANAIGIGEGGVRAINHMLALGIDGVNCITVHTDKQSVRHSNAARKLTLADDSNVLRKPGQHASSRIAKANIDCTSSALDRTDMVFIIPDLRDATAVGIASVIARRAQERSRITLGVAMQPFSFEDKQCRRTARANEEAFALCVDSLIVIPGTLVTKRRKAQDDSDAFHGKAYEFCRVAVQGLYDGIGKGEYHDIANPDPIQQIWQDYRGLLGAKTTLLEVGAASGRRRAVMAVLKAFNSPFLENTWKNLRELQKVLISITARAGSRLSRRDVCEAVEEVKDYFHSYASTVLSVSTEDSLDEELRIAVFAENFTGQ